MRALMIGVLLFAVGPDSARKNDAAVCPCRPPEIVSTSEAVYPMNAVNGGTVVLAVTVSESGEVQDIKVVRDAPGFTPSALQAVKQWKFKPARLNGKPVGAVIPVAFSFGFPAACAGR